MSQYKLGFIGAGAMAEAIMNGVTKSEIYKAHEIIASDINEQRLIQVNGKLNIITTQDNNEVMAKAETIILAIKPQHVKHALEKLTYKPDDSKIIISIAAGISTTFLENLLGKIPVIRVMPNTPALVGAGMTALSKGQYANEEHLIIAEKIFKSVGKTILIDELLIDAVTGLSGSGPAYVYQFIEALADGGVQVGLPRKTSYVLAAQTVIGAGLMVLETGLHPGELKDMVTSPGGATIRAISVLEKGAFRATVMDAVEASYLKSKQLGLEE
ncbi:MAG: pyrroline-5-carboxylate reductase [Clostridia bacterium]|nr:pyrroline-5-carboxylate reductase [Clostridia bacterium]